MVRGWSGNRLGVPDLYHSPSFVGIARSFLLVTCLSPTEHSQSLKSGVYSVTPCKEGSSIGGNWPSDRPISAQSSNFQPCG
jgi:hypothetical protein